MATGVTDGWQPAPRTERDAPAASDAPQVRPWWLNAEGFWRDEVRKDLVKHGVQVYVGVVVAVGFGLLEPDKPKAQALVGVAFAIYTCALIYVAPALVSRVPAQAPLAFAAGVFGLVAMYVIPNGQTSVRALGAIGMAAALLRLLWVWSLGARERLARGDRVLDRDGVEDLLRTSGTVLAFGLVGWGLLTLLRGQS